MALAAVLDAAPAIRPEFSLSLAQAHPRMKTDYIHRYVPPFFNGTLVGSATEQTLDVSAESAGNAVPKAALFFGKRIGVELSMAGFESSIWGSTTPDRVSVTYIAKQPPDYVAREYTVGSETPIPPPEGSLRTRAYSLDLVWRLGEPDGFAVDLSGGLSLLRFDADLKSLGYRRYWLGGHSVLFNTLSLLRLETEAATRLGANLGIAAAVRLAPALAVFAEARAVFGPETGLPVRFSFVEGGEGDYPGPSDLTGLSAAAPFKFDPSFWTLGIGLRIVL